MGPFSSRVRRLSHRGALLVAGASLAPGCAPGETPEGVLGEERLVYFEAPSDQVFAARLLVGSRFGVELHARREEDAARLGGGELTSSDASVASVARVDGPDPDLDEDDFDVVLVGAGEAELIAIDAGGEELDRVRVRAAAAERVELLDAKLVGASVDARLPAQLALLEDSSALFGVSAVDRCGGALLAFDAVEVTSSDEGVARVSSDDGVVFEVETRTAGEVELEVAAASGASSTFAVEVIAPEVIDRVQVRAAAAQQNQAELWARAFAADLEVVGLDYTWSSSERVSLSRDRGPNVIATISFPAEGAPPDTRPAIVEAEAHGEEGRLDLLSLRSEDLVTSRVPPREAPTPTPAAGCGSEPCDPTAAAALGVLWLPRLRRRRNPSLRRGRASER